jgi:hypothetical protein
MSLTPSEAVVERLCKASFLSLWSFPNPRVKQGKELCDLLVVCEPHVVIFSVKEIGLPDASDPTAVHRWTRKAIDGSIQQLYGAERQLAMKNSVPRALGSPGLQLPDAAVRRTHRIAVALGSGGNVPFEQRDFGKGFVHILDDSSLATVMEELDTIADFVKYLEDKEQLLTGGHAPQTPGGERDLLAIYLHRGRKFPLSPDGRPVVIDKGAWSDLCGKPEWVRRKSADVVSYLWDKLIEGVARDVLGPGLEFGTSSDAERATRIMAREDRFSRRVLADAFNGFMAAAVEGKTRARMASSPSGVCYVFLACARDEPREARGRELILRCVAARSMMPHYAPVVGMATERYVRGQGYSLDLCLVDIPNWTPDHQRHAELMKKELGFFNEPVYSRASYDEYPESGEVRSIVNTLSRLFRSNPRR